MNIYIFFIMLLCTGFLMGIGITLIALKYQVKKGRIPTFLKELGVKIDEPDK